MKRFQKDIPIELEFGDYGNIAMMTPVRIVKQFYCNNHYYPEWIIEFKYPHDDRTIELVIDEKEIDFDSFNV